MNLNPERWHRLQTLFEEASGLPADHRDAFVTAHCGDDVALAGALRGMLAASPDAPGVIRAAIDGARPESDVPAASWVGRSIGPYRIVREVGRGGMGLVFEAVRDDAYHQRVALKIAPWAGALTEIDARFRQERQILADLEHPGIARLLDGGSHDGTPYLVMEFIDGAPVTEYCRTRQLPVRARVQLAVQMCAALQYAHQHLVVHRDLKPSNILVADGVAKVLDFGVARLLHADGEASRTLGGTTGLTPDYASPEQVSGRPVSTRSDVYSLGLVLYEMLTGVRAQVADTTSALALARSIEREPPVASVSAARQGDAAAARELAGDLDSIVATAIRKEPDQRYASMDALAADLQRWLDGRPVLARPQTLAYRAAKAVRRHRVVAAAAVLVVAAVAAGVASTLYQARRAERQFQQVRKLARTMIVDVHDRIDDLAGATEAQQFIVATSLEYLEGLRQDAGTDPELAKELAAGYERVGMVQGHPLRSNLGDTAGAIASFRRADALLAPLEGRGDRVARQQLAETVMELADTLRATGDTAGAMEAYRRARALAERLVDDDPGAVEAVRRLAEICASQSRAALGLEDRELSEEAGRCAISRGERLVTLVPSDDSATDTLASALNAMGGALLSARPAESVEFYRRSIAIREALAVRAPDNANVERSLMVSYGNLGDVLGYRVENLGQTDAAIEAFRKAAAIADKALAADADDRRAAFDVVNATLRLGSVLSEQPATRDEALRLLQRADALNERLLSEEGAAARYGAVGLTLDRQLGVTLTALGRTREGITFFERVRRRAPPLVKGPAGPTAQLLLVRVTSALAEVHARSGDPRARALLDEVAGSLANPPEQTAAAARTLADLGRVHLALARRGRSGDRTADAEAAVARFEQAAAIWRGLARPADVEHIRTKALSDIDGVLAEARSMRNAGWSSGGR